jgi:hypothetical protein
VVSRFELWKRKVFFFEIREIEREKKLIEGVDYGEPVACFTD